MTTIAPLNVAPEQIGVPQTSRRMIQTGWVLSGLVILFLTLDSGLKIAALPIVSETVVALGWRGDPGFWRGMGLLLLAITTLYAWPRTAVLGAVLLTAYLGGAVATHLRIGSPLFSHALFGVYLGVAAWAGLWLRDPRIRALLPMS
jgi:DoxX-like family